jgi:hypothetical protein
MKLNRPMIFLIVRDFGEKLSSQAEVLQDVENNG